MKFSAVSSVTSLKLPWYLLWCNIILVFIWLWSWKYSTQLGNAFGNDGPEVCPALSIITHHYTFISDGTFMKYTLSTPKIQQKIFADVEESFCFVCWAILLFCWLYHFAAVKSEKIKPWISLGFTVETQDVEKMDNFATDIYWSRGNTYKL